MGSGAPREHMGERDHIQEGWAESPGQRLQLLCACGLVFFDLLGTPCPQCGLLSDEDLSE